MYYEEMTREELEVAVVAETEQRGRANTMPDKSYQHNSPFGGFKVRRSATGFVVERWSRVEGEITDSRVLVAFPVAVGGAIYTTDSDLGAAHNQYMTVADVIADISRHTGRTLRRGFKVR